MIVELASRDQAATLHNELVRNRFPVALNERSQNVIETQAPRKAVEALAQKLAVRVTSIEKNDFED